MAERGKPIHGIGQDHLTVAHIEDDFAKLTRPLKAGKTASLTTAHLMPVEQGSGGLSKSSSSQSSEGEKITPVKKLD